MSSTPSHVLGQGLGAKLPHLRLRANLLQLRHQLPPLLQLQHQLPPLLRLPHQLPPSTKLRLQAMQVDLSPCLLWEHLGYTLARCHEHQTQRKFRLRANQHHQQHFMQSPFHHHQATSMQQRRSACSRLRRPRCLRRGCTSCLPGFLPLRPQSPLRTQPPKPCKRQPGPQNSAMRSPP